MESLETYALAAAGLVKGVFEVYVKPFPGDAIKWAANRLVSLEMPSQEDIDRLIAEVAAAEYE